MAANVKPSTIFTGDNLDILRGFDSECIDLVYLDPPFSKNTSYAAPIGSKAAGAWFKDTWTWDDIKAEEHGLLAGEYPGLYKVVDAAGDVNGRGMKAYVIMMALRLIELKRILKPTGSIYLHCDHTASHYLKLLMDAIFGRGNFIAEITWFIGSRSGAVAKYKPGKAHETILAYAVKYGTHLYNVQYLPYSDSYLKWFKYKDDDGRKYRTRTRRGKLLRQYLDESPGVPLHDTWMDISHLYTSQGWFPGNRDEITGYPTQKPLALLERIIKASSNPDDVVLDPFCGCATTLVAAHNLERKWIGIDISPKAVDLVQVRLRDAQRPMFSDVIARNDIPVRTDIADAPPYRTQKHTLFGLQEGYCAGCRATFQFRNFTIDHIVPQSKGGTDHIDNLQLLCGYCNSKKGNRSMSELLADLRREGILN